MPLLHQLKRRPRLLIGAAVGALLALLWPSELPWHTRLLLGWSAGVWTYLTLVLQMMLRTAAEDVETQAQAIADGMPTVLGLAMVGALASLAAIALELAQVREAGIAHGWPHLLVVFATVTGSWLLLPVEFALAYASLFHTGPNAPHGVEFPGDDPQPDYLDFVYFAVTLAATSQTSDVAVSARPIRRLVLVQTVLAFVFNTVVLALTINMLASLLS
ncbi:DUF1345 domain-containing protein [Roseateles amylovorans]|uniref:DUF1345 domain-containing protein n=1 Tax=Roseateles amylovorans TaxID=2978473 RepID=A0ABY6B4Y2_9BURK|nr:DUF1345 domain-containing protein [Roseateles amylovorans]UXH80403.1 DUF1345 domain-containing protein [Roseateles amylovorans]